MPVFNQGNGNTTQVPSATAEFGFMENGDPKFYNCTVAQIAERLGLTLGDGEFSVADIITKGPWVDVRSFMDGLSGRNTLAAWEADPTIDVTAALQAAINYGSVNLLSFTYVTGPLTVTAKTRKKAIVATGSGGLKAKTGLDPYSYLITIDDDSVDCCVVGVQFDLNNQPTGGVLVNGLRNGVIECTFRDILSAVGSLESAVEIRGDDCYEVNNRSYNLLRGTAANPSVPRCFTAGSGALNARSINHVGHNAAAATVIATTDNCLVENFCFSANARLVDDESNNQRNGHYILAGASNCTVRGGTLKKTNQPFVDEGTNTFIQDVTVIDPYNSLIAYSQGAEKSVIEGVKVRFTAEPSGGLSTSSFVATRGFPGFSADGVTIRNCDVEWWLTDVGILSFFNSGGTLNGPVNDLVVEGNRFHIKIGALATATRSLVRHDTGNAVTYRNNDFVIEDTLATLTSAEIFTISIPTVTKESIWSNNTLQAIGSQTIRVVGAFQDLVIISALETHTRVDIGPYINQATAVKRKEVVAFQAPAIGAWTRGDIVWNTLPAAAGTLGWICTASGSPGTWKAIGGIAT